jgi:hypothetical protein
VSGVVHGGQFTVPHRRWVALHGSLTMWTQDLILSTLCGVVTSRFMNEFISHGPLVTVRTAPSVSPSLIFTDGERSKSNERQKAVNCVITCLSGFPLGRYVVSRNL